MSSPYYCLDHLLLAHKNEESNHGVKSEIGRDKLIKQSSTVVQVDPIDYNQSEISSCHSPRKSPFRPKVYKEEEEKGLYEVLNKNFQDVGEEKEEKLSISPEQVPSRNKIFEENNHIEDNSNEISISKYQLNINPDYIDNSNKVKFEEINDEELEHPVEHINIDPPANENQSKSDCSENEKEEQIEDPDGVIHKIVPHSQESHDIHHIRHHMHHEVHNNKNLDTPQIHLRKDSDSDLDNHRSEIIKKLNNNSVNSSTTREYDVIENINSSSAIGKVKDHDKNESEEQFSIITHEEVKDASSIT